MSQGAGAGGEGDDKGAESDSTSGSGSAKLPSKRGKGKSKGKVWEKVVWFTRRSRSRDLPSEHGAVADCEAAAFPNDVMDLDESPTRSLSLHSAITSKSWIESSSSSESELFENEDGYMVKRSRLYPNSEIIEQNCLKPSVARALFLQIEAANHRNGRLQKYSWQRKKKKICSFLDTDLLYNTDIESLSRAISMPSGITSKNTCHCRACCSCAPSEILQGLCPAHARLSTSTTSLDTGLSNLEGLECEFEQKTQKEAEPPEHSNENEQTYQQQAAEPISSSSVKTKVSPTLKYYSQSLQRKCKNCGEVIRQSPLPISDSGMLPTLSSQSSFCQCKQTYMVPRSEVTDESACSVSSRSHRLTKYPPSDIMEHGGARSRVEPVEFKSRHDTMKRWFHEFTDDQKNLLLKSLLLDCELPQMHLLSLEVEPRLHQGCPPNCQDRLSWLPTPLALHVFSFLDAVSLCQASSVSRGWYQLATEPSLWRRFCYHSKWQLSTNGEQKQLIHHMMPNGNIHWKKVFSERYRLRNNWLRGKCNVRTFEGHTQGISCVQFDDTRIVSGSHDKTIKVWNIRTNSPWSVQTLVGHSGTVRCLHLEGNRLVSGSTDRTIKVWDLSMQQSWSSIACKVTMIGHTDTVRCLQVDDDKVISGSYDKTLKVWDIRTGHCRMTLRGHDAAVLCVQFDDAKIVSGSCDKTIKVWNFTGSCMTTLHGHHDAVTCLQFDDTRIVSGSLDCNLKFWDVHTGTCMNTIDWKASEGHTGVVRCLQADSWRIVSASDDRTLKVWSLETGQRLVTLRNHTDGVTCLQFNDSIIVSGSYDKTVKLWDFSCC